MPLNSMTGFARLDSIEGDLRWYWEVRSVNNKGLDIKIKLPPDSSLLDQHIRDAISRNFSRGSISVTLNIQSDLIQSELKINEEVLTQVLKAVEHIRKIANTSPPTAEGLLSLTGVLEFSDRKHNLLQDQNIQSKILKSFDDALEKLKEERCKEGSRLSKILNSLIGEIEKQTSIAQTSPSRTPDAIKKRLSVLISRLVDINSNFDVSRIHQEAVLLAARCDIEEELHRLQSHIHAFKEILQGEGALGRRLEFLGQELHREANTLTSKAVDLDISHCGLELKTLIDKVREQVQNIE